MIAPPDILDALSILASNASDKTPGGEATAAAWLDHFNHYPHLNRQQLMDAVNMYCETPRERLVQPQDISQLARKLHQDSVMRNPLGSDMETVAIEPPQGREHDGSYYGKERVTREISIETKFLDTGQEQFRFVWDGPKHQPFCGLWYDTKLQAINDGIDWCERNSVKPDEDVTQRRVTGVEHSPGETCAYPSCPKPSTFNEFCARHYCMTKGVSLGLKFGVS